MSTPMVTTSADGWIQMCPNGPRWMTLDTGEIDVEGKGIVQAPTTGYYADGKFIPDTEPYSALFDANADKYGIPRQWPRAIAIVESRVKNTKANSASAGGIMALLPSTMMDMVGSSDLNNIPLNIEAGCKLLSILGKKYQGQLPAVAPAYNAGHAECSPTSKCHGTVDGKWQVDGTSAPTSMGFVEDCTAGHGSDYSIRVTALNNSLIAQGYGGDGGAVSGEGGTIARNVAIGAAAGAAAAIGASLLWEKILSPFFARRVA